MVEEEEEEEENQGEMQESVPMHENMQDIGENGDDEMQEEMDVNGS